MRSSRFVCLAAAFMLGCIGWSVSASAQAQFDVTVTPNNFTMAAGTAETITVNTLTNTNTPPGVTSVVYKLDLTSASGQQVGITTDSPQTSTRSDNTMSSVMVTITVPSNVPAGRYSGPLWGSFEDTPGNSIDFMFGIVRLSVTDAAPAPSVPCTATVEPAAIELTRDFKGTQVVVHTNGDCQDPEVRWSFAVMGTHVIADLCNIKVKKQPDGSYTDAKFTIRAHEKAEMAPEGLDWPITPYNSANQPIGEAVTVNIKLAGATVSTPPPQVPGGKGFSIAIKPDNITLKPGEVKTIEVHLTRAADFTNGVALRWEGHDPRVPWQTEYEQDVFQSADTAPKRITVRAAGDAAPGEFEMKITGAAGGEAFASDSPSSSLKINIADRDATASVLVEPGAFELSPGEERRVQITVKGENGWSGAVDVTAKGSAGGTTVSEESFAIDHLPGSHEITVKALPNAAPDHYAYVNVKVRAHANRNLIAETNIRSEVKAGAADFTVAVDPSRLELLPGQSGGVTLSVRRGSGWNGAVDVVVSGNDKVTIRPDRFRLDAGRASQEFEVTARGDAALTAGVEPSLMVKASPDGGGPSREAYVGLAIKTAKLARHFPAASGMLKNREYGNCLTIENNGHGDGAHLVMAACGSLVEAQTFTFGPNGEIQNGGKCAVLTSNQTTDDTPIILWTCSNSGNMNETWTFDSSSRLIGREFVKCMEPNASDPTHAVILRPCWDGGNQKWSVEQPPPPQTARQPEGTTEFDDPILAEALGGKITPPLRITVGQKKSISVYAKAQGATKSSPVDVILKVTVTVEGGGVSIQPIEFPLRLERLLQPRPGQACCELRAGSEPTVEVTAADQPGNATLRVTAVAADGATRTATLPMVVVADSRKGQWIEPQIPTGVIGDEDGPGAQHREPVSAPQGEPFAGVDAFPKSMAAADDAAAAFTGMAAAAAAAGEDVLDPEQIELLIAFSNAQSALLAELHNGTPLNPEEEASLGLHGATLPRVSEAALDDEIVRLFIRGGLRRNRANLPPPFQIASLGQFPFLFAMDFSSMAENKEMYNDIKSGKVDWRDLARGHEPVEILVNMMRLANQNAVAANNTAIVNDVLKETNDRIEAWGLDKITLKQWQVAVKTLSATATAISIIHILSEAQLRIIPSRIAELYSNVGGYSKRPDAPDPQVMQGTQASLKVYMTARSTGGEVVRLSQIAELVAKPVWEKMKGRIKVAGRKKGVGKVTTPGNDAKQEADEAALSEGIPGFDSKDFLKDLILEEINKRIAGIPALREWLQKLDAPITVKPYKRGPFLVNSERVLSLKYDNQHNNRSNELIKLGEGSRGHYYIEGLKPTQSGKTAGYSYGLQPWLIIALGRATEGLPCVKPSDPTVPPQCGLFRKGVVEVTPPPQRTCSLGPVGERCLLPNESVHDIALGYAGGGIITKNCECVSNRP